MISFSSKSNIISETLNQSVFRLAIINTFYFLHNHFRNHGRFHKVKGNQKKFEVIILGGFIVKSINGSRTI